MKIGKLENHFKKSLKIIIYGRSSRLDGRKTKISSFSLSLFFCYFLWLLVFFPAGNTEKILNENYNNNEN